MRHLKQWWRTTAVGLCAGPSSGFSSRGGQTPEWGPYFKDTVLDVCSNRGAKREMGGHRFQMGGPGTTGPPLATALLMRCSLTSRLTKLRKALKGLTQIPPVGDAIDNLRF